MKRLLLLLLLGLVVAIPVSAQVSSQNARRLSSGAGAPTATCTPGPPYRQVYINTSDHSLWECTAAPNTWTKVVSGGTPGTVTTSGSPASPQLAKFSSATAITTATATDVSTPSQCADAGASDTYACNLAPALASYVVGTKLGFLANTANTGAASINFNSLGALTIVKMAGGVTTALVDNDIRVGQWVEGTIAASNHFQMTSQVGNAASSSPGGSDTQVQFNDGGAFGGATITYAKPTASTTGTTTIGGTALTTTSSSGANASDVLRVTGPAGQASTSTSVESVGGDGAQIALFGGVGGAHSGAATDSVAGTGGLVQIIAGAGGAKTNTGTAGGGGDVYIDAGAAGSASGGADPSIDGAIFIGSLKARSITLGNATDATSILVPKTITAGGTTGNQTINRIAGTVNIAASGTTVTVTNSTVTANSIVLAVIRTNDATATLKNVVPGSGSFVITLSAAATGEISIGFFVIN